MITVTTIHNPFNEMENTIEVLDFREGLVVSDCLPDDLSDGREELTVVVAKNGHVLEFPYSQPVSNGDKIAVSVRVEVEAASAVAAAVATYATGAATLTSAIAAGGILGGLAYAAVYGAVFVGTMMAIGYGVNQLVSALGPDAPDVGGGPGSDVRESPTYGWGPLQQTETQGNPIPVLFGRQRVAGQVINQFKTVEDDDKEYLYLLLAVTCHEVDSISDIRINDQPYTNYTGVSVYTRCGSLNDDPIPGFGQIVQIQNVSILYKDNSEGHIHRTDGNAVEEIRIVFNAPSGLSYSNDQGGLDERAVDFEIKYKAVGDSIWTIYYGRYRISGATTEAIRRSVTISGLPPDQYDVSIDRITIGSDSFRETTDVYWSQMHEVIAEELIYPGIAKYAVKALATDQLSNQVPRVSCLVERSSVEVYDPDQGAWVYKNAENPAWAAYWLLNTHHGIHYNRLIYDEFEQWADWCDETVEGEARIRAGIYLDALSNAWENVQKIARIGRASIVRRGTKYGVFVDKPEDIVSHMFTLGNIIEATYSMTYLPRKDRANACEVTYNDPDRDYTNQVVAVYTDDYASPDSETKKSQIKFWAAIRRSQAIREAAFLLNSNKYLLRTVEFEASVDSFACVVGDLVYFQHMIPRYDVSVGGRIVDAGNDDGTGNPYVQLDREIELTAGGSYAVLVRLSDDSLVEKQVQPVGSDQSTDTLLLSSAWTAVPAQYDLYNAGPADTYKKPYRIISIMRSQELTRRITLMEYVEEIYSDTNHVIEVPTWGESVTQEAGQVSAREFLTYSKGGDYQSNLSVTWNPMNANVGSNWAVWLEDQTLCRQWVDDAGGEWEETYEDTANSPGVERVGETSANRLRIDQSHLVQGHEYKIYVGPIDAGMRDTGDNTTTIQILGKLAPPNNVAAFTGQWNALKRTVNLAWEEVDNLDVSHYEIRQGTTWADAGIVVKEAKKGSANIAIEEGVSETRTYLIKAVDTSGVYSVDYASVDIPINTFESPLSTPTGLSLATESGIASDGTDRVTLIAAWDNNAEAASAFRHYELTLKKMSSGQVSAYVTAETEYQWEVVPNTEYGAAVRAVDMTGNKTAWSSEVTFVSAKDAAPPAIPAWAATALVPGFKVIGLRWQKNTEKDLSHYEAQRSETGAFSGEQTDLGDKDGNFTTDSDLSVDTTYYYRLRAVDTSGNASDWSAVKSATTLKVGAADIAYNVLIAEHIDVFDLNVVTAKVSGTLSAGVLQSNNWGDSEGIQIDLDNEVFKVGGSDDPDFSWDGASLNVKGKAVVGEIDAGQAKITSSDGRTYFDGNTIYVYDSSGVLRVKIGEL